MNRTHFAALSPLLLLCACGPADAGILDVPVGLENAALLVPDDNPVTAEKAELGKILFFDPRLSSTGQMSCATCHPPEKAWADGERFSMKADGKPNTRNTPTVYNTGYLPRLYWDGRAETLEGNVLAAWKSQMSGDPPAAAKTLTGIKGYQDLFQAAFGGAVTEQRIVQALATFLRTLRSGSSPFDRWQAGDNSAVGNDVKIGYEVFNGPGACNACHAPPMFTTGAFHNAGIGMAAENPDPGRGKIDPVAMGAFKVPTLREVAKTAPYFHDASVATLTEAVMLMAKGGLDNPHKDPLMTNKNLSDVDLGNLEALLRSLSSDRTFTKPTLPQ